jgi:hypothetical protein
VANSYLYVSNEPLDYTDRLGLCRMMDLFLEVPAAEPGRGRTVCCRLG